MKSWQKLLILGFVLCLIATFFGPWLAGAFIEFVKHPGDITIKPDFIGALKGAGTNEWRFTAILYGLVIVLLLYMSSTSARLKKVSGDKPTRFAPPRAGNNEHGSAEFLTQKDMEHTTTVWDTTGRLYAPGDLVFGELITRNGEKVYLCNDDKCSIIIGSIGSGKTRRVILPSIYAIASSEHKDSMVITDVKDELRLYTADWLKSKGYNVVYFNFRTPEVSDHENPIQPVIDFLDSGDIPAAEQAAVDAATILVEQSTPKDRGGEPFWSNSSIAIIAGLIMLVAMEADPDHRNMTTVFDLLGELGKETHKRVPLNDLMDILPLDHPAVNAYRPARLAPDVTRGSMFTSALTDMRIFSNVNVSNITASSTVPMESIADRPTAVFIVTPEESSAYNSLASIYVAQLFTALTRHAVKNGGRLARRVHFLLDEFGNFPPIPDFATKLTTGRSRGIKFHLALQGFDQLDKRYGKTDAATIKANCDNLIFLKTAHVDTAKYISERMGKYTIRTDSASVSSSGFDSKSSRVSTSESGQLKGRELATHDELIRWNIDDGAIVLRTGVAGVARFPLHDLSEWSANKAFGMGTPEHNRDLLIRRTQALPRHDIKSYNHINPVSFTEMVYGKYVVDNNTAQPEPQPTVKKGGQLGAKLEWRGRA